MSMLAQVPLNTDIPLVLHAGSERPLRFWLPQPQAFDAIEGVWLTDHQTGTVTNLLSSDYTLQPTTGAADYQRLTLRLGSMKPAAAEGQDGYSLYVRQRMLHIDGLREGDQIQVFNAAGVPFRSVRAAGSHYATELLPGVYVVRVGSFVRKIRI